MTLNIMQEPLPEMVFPQYAPVDVALVCSIPRKTCRTPHKRALEGHACEDVFALRYCHGTFYYSLYVDMRLYEDHHQMFLFFVSF